MRDGLYNGLPVSVKMALRSRLQEFDAKEEVWTLFKFLILLLTGFFWVLVVLIMRYRCVKFSAYGSPN